MRAIQAEALLTVLVVLSIGLSGCGGSDGPQRGAVGGKITLDGEPVPEGAITFLPIAPNKGPAAGGAFKDGQYDVSAANGPVAGKNRVEISASRKTGRQVPGPMGGMVDERESIIPEQYNKSSTLEIDVQPGKNVFDFDLKSQ